MWPRRGGVEGPSPFLNFQVFFIMFGHLFGIFCHFWVIIFCVCVFKGFSLYWLFCGVLCVSCFFAILSTKLFHGMISFFMGILSKSI